MLSARVVTRSGGRSTLRLSVRDTGIGVALDRQEVIFESFTQADGSISRRYGGTGLGLTICRRLAQMMGGTIGLASEPGRGSEFWLELALTERAPAHGGSGLDHALATPAAHLFDDARARGSIFSGLRVLVAEDNATNQKVAIRMLDRLGCHADAVFNGREAITMLARLGYDLVLMDVQMPDMDGYVATAEIRRREKERGGHIPVIAMTAHAMQGDKERCLAAGMDDYISKPVTHDELADVIKRWCSPRGEPAAAGRSDEPGKPARQVLLELDRLREISGGDAACEHDVLHTFLGDAAAGFTAIGAALERSDATLLAAEAHKLLGASRTIGAASMADFCGSLEQTALRGPLQAARQALADFRPEYDRLCVTIADYMKTLGNSCLAPNEHTSV